MSVPKEEEDEEEEEKRRRILPRSPIETAEKQTDRQPASQT